jgi:tetratricopeptide (TPR) repeat protein
MKSVLKHALLICVLALSVAKAQVTPAQGNYYLSIEQYNNAAKVFEELSKTAPTPENQFYLGNYYLLVDKVAQAKTVFAKADALSAWTSVGLGSVAMAEGKVADAKGHFAKAVAISKAKNADILFYIGEGYTKFESKDAVEGIKFYEQAIKLNPKKYDFYIALGDAFLIQNDGTRAIAQFDKAKAINPKNPVGYLRGGLLMERARNYPEAVNEYKRGLEVDANYLPCYKELAEVYLLAGRPAEGLTYYETYIST